MESCVIGYPVINNDFVIALNSSGKQEVLIEELELTILFSCWFKPLTCSLVGI